jgi:hypothetical protein
MNETTALAVQQSWETVSHNPPHPAGMSTDDLKQLVADGAMEVSLRSEFYKPYYLELRNRLNRKEWEKFCRETFDRTRRAIDYWLAGGNPVSKRKPKVLATLEPAWEHLHNFISAEEANELFNIMLQQSWEDKDDPSIHYGISYQKEGGARDGEIPEIPSFLASIIKRVENQIGMPVNYVQCHRYSSAHAVHPHKDPAGMIVPMLILGQARSFRVGGRMPHYAYQFKQNQRKIESHEPEQTLLLNHGDLLVFNGGKVLHSMFAAEKDEQFQPNGFPCRITLLFRFTTPAMREHGPIKNDESVQQYQEAMGTFRNSQGKPTETESEKQKQNGIYDLLSALQKAIRRNNEREALLAAWQLDAKTGHSFKNSKSTGGALWSMLRHSCVEDIGLANPAVAADVYILWKLWEKQTEADNKHEPWRLFTTEAVMLLCQSPKSRRVDHACIILSGRVEQMVNELRTVPQPHPIPAYTHDGLHTGTKNGKTLADFVIGEDAALSPRAEDIDDPYKREINAAIQSAAAAQTKPRLKTPKSPSGKVCLEELPFEAQKKVMADIAGF